MNCSKPKRFVFFTFGEAWIRLISIAIWVWNVAISVLIGKHSHEKFSQKRLGFPLVAALITLSMSLCLRSYTTLLVDQIREMFTNCKWNFRGWVWIDVIQLLTQQQGFYGISRWTIDVDSGMLVILSGVSSYWSAIARELVRFFRKIGTICQVQYQSCFTIPTLLECESKIKTAPLQVWGSGRSQCQNGVFVNSFQGFFKEHKSRQKW